MTRPKIQNIDAAIRIYFDDDYMSCKDIREIFGNMGSARMARLRREVRAEEAALGIPVVVPQCICTKVAFDVWQIDIEELIEKRQRLKKLKLI